MAGYTNLRVWGKGVVWGSWDCFFWIGRCQEAALTRRIAWQRSGEGVGISPSGKQLHPATPELTAWQERPADSSQ